MPAYAGMTEFVLTGLVVSDDGSIGRILAQALSRCFISL
jgi:hypothetical protein